VDRYPVPQTLGGTPHPVTARTDQATGVDPSRARAAVRELLERPTLVPRDLMAPLLVHPEGPHPDGLPGSVCLPDVVPLVSRWTTLGIRGIKLFVVGSPRDAHASGAVSADNLMVKAIREVKTAAPDMVVTTEVCGCSWTDTGECTLLVGGRIDVTGTYRLMADMAQLHAAAGADAVSPTAMLDGSVRAVRNALTEAQLPDVGVCPNIAVHTCLYGPFKRVMGTDPSRGHRRGLQLEPGRADRDALTQADRWLAEGADALTLQPVMTATDILVRLRLHTRAPLIAYSTSGEYAALTALDTPGMIEYHAALKRAGADLILSFAAEQVARALA
jgi:porphobilinogen synthase